jgi:small conductance mechanosensitive channel
LPAALWLLLLVLLLAGGPNVRAQTLPVSAPAAHPVLLTPSASAFVLFNDRVLFPVYTFGDQSAQDRADLANLRLAEALRNISANEASAQPPQVTVGERDGQTVLLLDGKMLLTVTQADADHAAQPAVSLAQTWADTLNRSFRQALRERQPAYLRWAAERAALLLLAGMVVYGMARLLAMRLGHRLGIPFQLLLGGLLLSRILDLFPQTRPVNLLLLTGPLRPLTLCLLVGLPAAVLVRVWGITLGRLFPPIPEHLSAQERTERTFQRRVTLARVGEVAGASVIWLAAGLTLTTWLGVNLSALLTSAGLITVALGFVAQDALRDFVASLYILADDRFGVGDTIQVGVYEGRVERLNLRATQIRDMSGRLITISNRGITEVANLTARWAQVDFKVGVSYYDDVDKASALLLAAAQALAEEWPDRVLAPPELLGVDSFTEVNVMLRLTLRTPPGDQWAVARELRRRVKHAFDTADIAVLNTLYAPPAAPPRGPGDATSD